MNPTLLIVLCLASTAGIASAQTHQESGVFVHGGAFASHELRSHQDVNADGVLALVAPTDTSSTVPGGTAGIGVFLRPFLSVQADALFEGESDQSLSSAILTTLLADLPGISRPATQNARTRNFSVQALLAYHLASSTRFRLAVLGGVSFNRRRTQFSSELFIPAIPVLPGITPPLPTGQIDYVSVSYNRDVVAGVDGELVMGQHVALVPQFRVVGGSGYVRLQPGVSVRWRP
jgi:hypothetical protein